MKTEITELGDTRDAEGFRLERVWVETEHPVALDSPDHLRPWGTAHDNSRNPLFNAKLYRLFGSTGGPLRVLDLGCSGGGAGQDCIDDGCIAVGVEGSDYSLRMSRAAWPALGGKFLFTADITRDFDVRASWDGREERLAFDVITAWEVMEHIPREAIAAVCGNVARHLRPGGLAIFSISPNEQEVDGARLHQTVECREWWLETFARNGLHSLPQYERYFNSQYIRGPKQDAPGSFHVFLSVAPNKSPTPPRLTWRARLLDSWYGSPLFRVARRLLVTAS